MAHDTSKYSDLDMKLRKLTSGDISKVTDEAAINQSLLSLFNTNRGERMFNPTYGSRLPFLLFEPFDALNAQNIVDDIQQSTLVWEPRIEITDLDIDLDFDKQIYTVTLVYKILSTTDIGVFETILENK